MKGKNMRLYKRIASIALVLFLVVGLVPMMPVEVKATEGPAYMISNGYKAGDVYWFRSGIAAIVNAPTGYEITGQGCRSKI